MGDYEFHDSHFHPTNYIQEGIALPEYLKIMGNKVGRAAIFGLPSLHMISTADTRNSKIPFRQLGSRKLTCDH